MLLSKHGILTVALMSKTKDATRDKLLGWLFPSISEAEFVFFVSLLFFGISGQVIIHYRALSDFFNFSGSSDDVRSQLFILAAIFMIAYSFVRPALKVLTSNKMIKFSERRCYVLIPSLYLAILWAFSILTKGPEHADSTIVTIFSTLVMIRFMAIIFVVKYYSVDDSFDKFSAKRFDNYQMTVKESCYVVVLGIIGAVTLLFVKDWLNWMIIIYGIGAELIKKYRQMKFSGNMQ